MPTRGWVLITGASRGIGAECALLAAAQGFAVGVNFCNDEQAANSIVARVADDGGIARALRADVSDDAQVCAMFAQLDATGSPLAGLINSAGLGGGKVQVEDIRASDLDRLFKVNVIGTMLCCREAVKRMSTRYGGNGGAIVNISSMAATIGGRAGSSTYAASKAAVDAFTTGLAKEVGNHGIRVNAIRPGMTATDMPQDTADDPVARAEIAATIPMNRIASAREVAHPAVWLLGPEASFVSGAHLDVSGGGFLVGKPLQDAKSR